jgi:hypothetical protein
VGAARRRRGRETPIPSLCARSRRADKVVANSDEGVEALFGAVHGVYGTELRVPLPRGAGSGVSVTIDFATTENSLATQWLEPSQTADKTHPFMFTQCQVRASGPKMGRGEILVVWWVLLVLLVLWVLLVLLFYHSYVICRRFMRGRCCRARTRRR